MAKMKVDWKKVLQLTLLGTFVMQGVPFVLGYLNTWLSFIPSMEVLGISVPHGLIAIGLVAFVGDLVLKNLMK